MKWKKINGSYAEVARLSIYVNLFLLAVKLATGIITGSLGIIAEFIHSFFDLLASVFAYLGIMKAAQPADKTHPSISSDNSNKRYHNFRGIPQTDRRRACGKRKRARNRSDGHHTCS